VKARRRAKTGEDGQGLRRAALPGVTEEGVLARTFADHLLSFLVITFAPLGECADDRKTLPASRLPVFGRANAASRIMRLAHCGSSIRREIAGTCSTPRRSPCQ
jgi:hypothetical protein